MANIHRIMAVVHHPLKKNLNYSFYLFHQRILSVREQSTSHGDSDIKYLEKKRNELLHEIEKLEKQKALLHSSLHGPLEGAVHDLNDSTVDKYIDFMGASFAALDNHPYVVKHKGQWPEDFIPFVGLLIKVVGEAIEKSSTNSSDSD